MHPEALSLSEREREGGREGRRERERKRERASESAKVQRAGGGGRRGATAQRKIYCESNEAQHTRFPQILRNSGPHTTVFNGLI